MNEAERIIIAIRGRMSAAKAARAAGLNENTVRFWFRNPEYLRLTAALDLLKAAGVTRDEICTLLMGGKR